MLINILIALIVFGLMGAFAVYGYRQSARAAERLGQRPSAPEGQSSANPPLM